VRGTLRTFIAIELADEVKKGLSRAIERLAALDDTVKWVAAGNLHLTVKFLGDVPENLVPELLEALRDITRNVGPFELKVAGLGAFPSVARPRVVWAGCDGPADVLGNLARDVDRATRFTGAKADKRRFVGHITLGRVRGKGGGAGSALARAIDEAGQTVGGTTEVEGLSLFMSELSRAGPTYTLLGRAKFSSVG